MSLGSIVVRLTMNTADFETDAGRAAKIAERRAKEIDSAFRKAGVAIGAALGVAIVGFGKYIKGTIEAEKVQAQLTARIKDTGSAAGRTLDQLNEQAEKLQGVTIFDDEAIGEAQAMLLTFKGISGVQFDKTVESALDLATVMGTDATDAAKLLGKALADPEKGMSALSRAGIVFTESERDAIKAMAETGNVAKAQDAILAKLEGSMGSAAEAARGTLWGALQGLSNAFDNLLEGDAGGDGVRGTVGAVNSLADTLNDPSIKAGVDNLAGGLLTITSAAVKAVAWLGNATSAVAEYYGATSRQSMNVLQNRRNDLETELFKVQRRSGQGLGDANDPLAKLFGLSSGKDGKLAEIKAEIAAIDARMRDLRTMAQVVPENRFSPAYERASLNFDPNPAGAAAGGGKASSSRGGSRAAGGMPDFLRDDQEALRRMVEEAARANEQFDRMAATLSGPLAVAELEHQNALAEITRLGVEAGRSSEEIASLKGMEIERYQDQRSEIEATLNPMQALLDAMQAEIGLIGVGNTEREMMNALRAQGIDLASREAQGYLQTARALEEERTNAERAFSQQVETMDGLRDSARGFLDDLRAGEGVWDALGNAADRFADTLFDIASRNLIEQIFGGQGTAGSGSMGGWLGSLFGGLFGGGGATAGGGQFAWVGAGYKDGGFTGRGGVALPTSETS